MCHAGTVPTLSNLGAWPIEVLSVLCGPCYCHHTKLTFERKYFLWNNMNATKWLRKFWQLKKHKYICICMKSKAGVLQTSKQNRLLPKIRVPQFFNIICLAITWPTQLMSRNCEICDLGNSEVWIKFNSVDLRFKCSVVGNNAKVKHPC